jgi:hypothetical protein
MGLLREMETLTTKLVNMVLKTLSLSFDNSLIQIDYHTEHGMYLSPLSYGGGWETASYIPHYSNHNHPQGIEITTI